ncbi:MAG: FKBP-type peptidyl-prolyl cis-trans isomerase [Bacteroidales bacterium]|jgi:hypothetical protein|nr:FKBP-type peptidyl-prolyl cis-trans isomerase [Bacteroidales bacterium]MCI2122496.1 FKBP-type peptidyl-prolyl cis-trans isomerase [Bacteroidales bacterium]MCI2145475.1 FKBP-type peptidyl-prolyl cis-trans isomerase [Bacteroidales bacterium]
MKRLIIIPALAVAATLIFSCREQNAASTYATEESSIDSYVYKKFDSTAVHHYNGSTRVTLTEASEGADSLERGDSTYFYWAGYMFSNGPGTLFSTNDPKVSSAYQDTVPAGVKLGETSLIPGLENGLIGIRNGEEAYIVFSGKYGFGEDGVYDVTPLSALIYHIRIKDIIKEKNQLSQ